MERISLFFLLCAIALSGCRQQSPPVASLDKESLAADRVVSFKRDDFRVANASSYRSSRQVDHSIVIGLDADMTSGAAQAGEAIRRGVQLAIDEVNREGGLLDRPLELIVRDHRGNPERGIDNMVEFSEMRDILAVVGGIHTPVAIRQLETIHRHQMIYLGPWAAGTPVVANGYSPNFVFRVSVRDEYAGGFLIDHALDRGFKRVGMLLERTSWGRSNELAMETALQTQQLKPAAIEWFNWGEQDFARKIDNLITAGSNCIVMVCNPLEGATIVNAMAERSVKVPIISHWGITGGDFVSMTQGRVGQVDLAVLQTFSFIDPRLPTRSAELFAAYRQRYDDCESPRDVFSPVGTAHAYEIVMMLCRVVKDLGTIDRERVRDGLEQLASYDGLIRDYDRPFPADCHDALTVDDFIMARFEPDGAIVPLSFQAIDSN